MGLHVFSGIWGVSAREIPGPLSRAGFLRFPVWRGGVLAAFVAAEKTPAPPASQTEWRPVCAPIRPQKIPVVLPQPALRNRIFAMERRYARMDQLTATGSVV